MYLVPEPDEKQLVAAPIKAKRKIVKNNFRKYPNSKEKYIIFVCKVHIEIE
jgi:hypothetical protein